MAASFAPLEPSQLLLLGLGAFLIGVSKTGFGAGLGMLVTPMLALFLPARLVIGAMLPLLMAGDIYAMRAYWRAWDGRNVLLLVPGALVGIALGSLLIGVLSDLALKRAIGLAALAFGPLYLVQERLREGKPFLPPKWLGLTAGALTGVASTIAHAGGVVSNIYLLPQRLPNRIFVGTCVLLYFVVNLTKLPPYLKLGLVNASVLGADLLLFPAILLGAAAGVWVNRALSERAFHLTILGLTLAAGLKLVLWP